MVGEVVVADGVVMKTLQSSAVVLALLVSAYFYPIWTAETIPFSQLQPHMWIPSWN